jgi:phosphoribosylglycinamide formyltransferase 1
MKKIAIFASGSGTNAENIIKYFTNNQLVKIEIILSNKPDALVLERAKKYNIDTFVFKRSDFYELDIVYNLLNDRNIDNIILAGFLWLMPDKIIRKFTNKIINIHPALLPKYGGKGMYGTKVHEAVIRNNEKESGISIHYVNENYDDGELIYQAKCHIEQGETPESLANKIHSLEYEHFPRVIEKWIFDNP